MKTSKVAAEKIKVCIRLRPLLAPYEDEEVWGVDYRENRVTSMNANTPGGSTDPMAIVMNQIQQQIQAQGGSSNSALNINAFIKEKELRRRYQDAAQTQSFQFDNVFGPDSKTPQIYQSVVRPITRAALQGYNGTVFMYG
jgi:centromeric protein E